MFTKEQLVNIGAENLAGIILSLYEAKPDVQMHLNVSVASFDPDSEKIVTIIEEEIESLKDSCPNPNANYDRESETDKKCAAFADHLDQVRKYITERVLPNFPDQAIKMLSKFLDTHEVILDQRNDYGIKKVFQQACADLVKAYERTNPPLGDVVNLVYDRFMENKCGVYDDIIRQFKDVLKDDGLSLLTQKLEKSKNYRNKKGTVCQGLKDIADCLSDVDAYIKCCFLDKEPDVSEHLDIAERLIKLGRDTEAIQWLDSPAPSKFYADRKRMLRFQALEQCGDHEAAQKERLDWFETTLSLAAYNEVLKNTEEDFIESFKKIAIEKALYFPNVYVAFTFLQEIKDLEQVGTLVKLKINSLDGSNKYTLRPIAEALQKVDPLAATLLHRKLMEPVLAGTKCRYYNWATKDLATCHSLSPKITDWQRFQNHREFFQKISVEHKRKISFWPEYQYELSLQKKAKKKPKKLN